MLNEEDEEKISCDWDDDGTFDSKVPMPNILYWVVLWVVSLRVWQHCMLSWLFSLLLVVQDCLTWLCVMNWWCGRSDVWSDYESFILGYPNEEDVSSIVQMVNSERKMRDYPLKP